MLSTSKTNVRVSNVDEIVFRGINTVVSNNRGAWVGCMTDLAAALRRVSSKRQRTVLPGSPSALRVVINRVVNRLRNRGVSVRFGRTTDHTRTRFVRFSR
jgi:hypothetical protein